MGAFAKSQPLSPKVPEEEPDLLGQISIRVVGISCVPPPEKTAERESQSESQPKLQPKSQHESHPESQSETVKANAEPVEATSTANGDKRKHKQLLSLQENSEDSRPFSVFEHFGFRSGRDGSKLDGVEYARSENELIYLPAHAAAYLSCKVEDVTDLGTHKLFLAQVTDGETLSSVPAMTYAYYHANVKPKPAAPKTGKKGWRCKICGYVYEGETLPADFICPLCKHPASDFEPID